MHQASLNLDEPASSLRTERHELVKVILRKGIPFSSPLNFDEQSASGFNQIHIHLSLRIFFVVQIQQQLTVHHTDARRSHVVSQRQLVQNSVLNQPLQRQA